MGMILFVWSFEGLTHRRSAFSLPGAGIMALPRAFATLGLVLGGGLLALVFAISLFSLRALITAAQATRCWTYSELAAQQFGSAGSAALRFAIVINNAGSMIVYLIIMGDVLCGVAPDYSGLITNLLGVHDPSVVWASRPFVMAVVCAVCLAPLLALRNLRLLAPMSTAAVGVAGLFVSSVVGLAVLAATQGALEPIQWFPAGNALGHSPAEIAITLIAIIPVLAMSFICHYQLLPVVSRLKKSSFMI
jgi:amino acid permease